MKEKMQQMQEITLMVQNILGMVAHEFLVYVGNELLPPGSPKRPADVPLEHHWGSIISRVENSTLHTWQLGIAHGSLATVLTREQHEQY